MTAWSAVPLSELVLDGRVSYGIVQPRLAEGSDVPVVRVKDVRYGRIDRSNPLFVGQSVSDRHSRTVLTGGELLLTLVGTVGESAVVPEELAGWNVARAIAVIRPSDQVEATWLRLCFATESVKHYLSGVINTTVQSTLNLADLNRVVIPLPKRSTRQGIVEVLGALDDKMAANAALRRTTDELAVAIFQDALGECLSVPLVLLARFVNGRAFTKGATGHGRVVIRIAELNSGIGSSTVYTDVTVAEDHLAKPGDLLFAWSGSLTLHRWFREEAIINQHIFKVIPASGVPMWVAHQALIRKLDDFRAIAADKATTMGHIQRRHLEAPVAVPRLDEIERIDSLMTTLWQTAVAAEKESVILAELRKTLLPHLMSGRLRVKDAERQVEAVV